MPSNMPDRSGVFAANRRSLNVREMYSMGFVDMKSHSDEDGWPYPDSDEPETTECYHTDRFSRLRKSGRKPESGIKPPV